MGVIGDIGRFQQYQMGNAMMAMAENPSGGAAGEGLGLGMGFAMANQVAQGMGQGMGGAARAPVAPPPVPSEAWHVAVNTAAAAAGDITAPLAQRPVLTDGALEVESHCVVVLESR